MLEIQLFGTFEARVDGKPLVPLRSRKEHKLLALLALSNLPIQRESLADTLWPDLYEKQAYLRQTLSFLRKALGAEKDRIQVLPSNRLQLDLSDNPTDVATFDAAFTVGDVQALERAVSLYRAPLLEGWDGDWVRHERAIREEKFLNILEKLAAHAIAAEDPTSAVEYLRRCIQADPLRERAYVFLMHAYFACGDYAEITRAYHDLRLILHQELHSSPAPETLNVYNHLQQRAKLPVFQLLQSEPPRRRLPMAPTKLVGRECDIESVTDLLDRSRLVTLTGAGGVGKTRLSIAVAKDYENKCADGVWFVELASIMDPRLVPRIVAQALNIPQQRKQSIEDTLVNVCLSRSLLLILDNCEHLLDSCSHLAENLLSHCPDLRILTTSRQTLGISRERVYQVSALDVPSISHLPNTFRDDKDAEHYLRQYDGSRLFLERAEARRRGFRIKASNAIDVAQICYRLEGIPLAIELAAARVQAFPVEEINKRLTSRFDLLTDGDRTALPRHKTLRAAFDWSYDLLSSKERRLLARLSVFAGGWTLPAAEQVGTGEASDGDSIEDWEVLGLLSSLVDKSLVLVETQEVRHRYRLLETIRMYARELLEGSEELLVVRERHLDYCLRMAESVKPNLTGSNQTEWLEVLEEEHDNLRLALALCLELPQGGEKGLRLGASLQRFWWTRGHLTEGRERLSAALSHPGAQNHTKTRANALIGAGALARMQGDYVATRSLYEEGLNILQELGDRGSFALCVGNLGAIACEQGDYASAFSLQEQSLSICRELGDKSGIASSLGNLGHVAYGQGDYTLARALFEECLTLEREVGDMGNIALCLGNLGVVAIAEGDYVSARSLQEESLAMQRKLGDRGKTALCLSNLGIVACEQGDYELERSLYDESLKIYRELGDKGGISLCLGNLGIAACKQGDYASAFSLQEQSLAICQELGDMEGIAYSLEAFASLAFHGEAWKRSTRIWGGASALREALGSPLPPNESKRQEREIRSVQNKLGEAEFASNWEEGYTMGWEQVVTYALTM